jgi:transposase-like protein
MPQTKKNIYRQLCDKKPIPLFMQAWWMDAVCGKHAWDVLMYERDGIIMAAWPLLIRKKFFYRYIIQPQLTQFNGVWIDYSQLKNEQEKHDFESEIMNYFRGKIEEMKVHYVDQNFHYSVTNLEGFVLHGFTKVPRVTYTIDNISNPQQVFERFSYAKKKHIKKAEGLLQVDYNMSAEEFYAFQVACLKQKKQTILFSKQLFFSIYEAALQRNQALIISVKDKLGNVHAASFYVWDAHSSYYLISAIDKNYRSSGASTLMVWETIKYLSAKTKVFDFEGSMIEAVANSFKQFGTMPKTYYKLYKYNSWSFKLLMNVRKKICN